MPAWMKWTAAIVGGVCLVLAGILLWIARPSRITSMVESGLAEHTRMDVTLDRVDVLLLPRPRITASGLTIRIPGQPDLPPFIAIDELAMNIGPFSLLRKQVNTVRAHGLRIAVPPGDVRDDLPAPAGDGGRTEIVVRHFITEDASLEFVRAEPDKEPLTFLIHNLHVRDVGFGQAMPFDAILTNPVPTGLVRAQGEIGPWLEDNGVRTPLSGDYTFEEADLATINGIGGMLASTGTFSGTIQRIAVTGEARVPDFNLDLGGRPAPLTASFDATVTGTDGTTVLDRVDAVLVDTPMTVTGAITNLPGPGNRDVDLTVQIDEGRIEDLLGLVIDSPEPVMTGDVRLEARVKLPPGETPAGRRLQIDGRFGLAETQFTHDEVQQKMAALSRRSQGKDEDEAIGRVMTNLSGQVRLANGVARLNGLRFQVPGARVTLDGTYALASGALDFKGELRMQATVSQAVGGFKSIFLKPFNPLFRKDGAGAVLPIKIEGTRHEPKFGLEVSKIF